MGWFALAMAFGCALVWARSEIVAAQRVERPTITTFEARVEKVEPLVAKGDVRLTLAPSDPALPPRVRVSAPAEDAPAELNDGARVRPRARLTGPPPMALPGTYDFARDAWFRQIGAAGRALGPVKLALRAAVMVSMRSAIGSVVIFARGSQDPLAQLRRRWPTATTKPRGLMATRRCLRKRLSLRAPTTAASTMCIATGAIGESSRPGRRPGSNGATS